jgi:hypothetical protein
MFDLIDEIEEAIKKFLNQKGFGWLFLFIAIGFSVGKWFLSIFIARENKKFEQKSNDEKSRDEVVKPITQDVKKDDVKKDLEKRVEERIEKKLEDSIEKEKSLLGVWDGELPSEEVSERTKVKEPKKIKVFSLGSILENKNFRWFLLIISFLLMYIENFLKMDILVGGWHIVSYVLVLVPLLYLVGAGKLENTYTRLFLPFLLVFIVDMFYYNNYLVEQVLPIIFWSLLVLLHITSTHKVHASYQTILPTLHPSFDEGSLFKGFFGTLWSSKIDKKILKRVAFALLITVPFLTIFLMLLLSADSEFGKVFEKILEFDIDFDMKYLLTIPLFFFLYLFLFIYSFSNQDERLSLKESTPFDLLIVGIFVGMINLLFFLFIALQIPFLLSENYTPEGISIAEFAREGFFQLMSVMGIVLVIFIFIMRRFKGEKLLTFLLSGLLFSTIMMGVVSVKKMHLYQTLKGATVLRYYVEWFDYLLLIVLAFGIFFLFKKIKFEKLLSLIVFLSFSAFSVIVSLNIDGMVTAHNLKKFENQPELLDISALEKLSIDALPVTLEQNIVYTKKHWFIKDERKSCKDFSHYHVGYCSKLELLEKSEK